MLQRLNHIRLLRFVGMFTWALVGCWLLNIWLDPEKLQGYGLSASQVLTAVRGQNAQFAAGSIGSDPAPEGQGFTATVAAEGRFSTPEEFTAQMARDVEHFAKLVKAVGITPQ